MLGEMRRGRRERIEKGSRESIETERKEKETKRDNLKRRKRNITTCLACACYSASSRYCGTPPKALGTPEFPT